MAKEVASEIQNGRLEILFKKEFAIIEQSRRIVYVAANVAEVLVRCRKFYFIANAEKRQVANCGNSAESLSENDILSATRRQLTWNNKTTTALKY